MERESFECRCGLCKGLGFTAPKGYVHGNARQMKELIHNYAQHAHGPSPVSAAIRRGSGVQPIGA